MITDSLPGLALGVDTGNPDIMKNPPRDPKESLFASGGYTIAVSFRVVLSRTIFRLGKGLKIRV